MDDTKIIKLYFQRSESAIGETVKKYGAYLNQVAYNILRCREDTEEIVSDTYVAAWNSIPPTVPSSLKHYLSRITRNLSFDRMDYLTAARRNTHMNILLSELEVCLPDPQSSMEEQWEAKEIGRSLNRFLATLRPGDCQIFLARYFYCQTIRDIADNNGISESKAKYRLSVLRGKLRTHLAKEGITV